MPPKKKKKSNYKFKKQFNHKKNQNSNKLQADQSRREAAVEDETSSTAGPPRSRDAHESGQASTIAPREMRPWHDPYNSYLYPPTSLNFRPPFDSDGSHLSRQSPGLTEYEGKVVGVLGSMMAPGQEQQQHRNQLHHHHHHHHHHQPPQPRSYPQQSQNHQRSNPNGIPIDSEPQQRYQNNRERDIERDQQRRTQGASTASGPLPSHIQVAKPYVFQQAIEGCLKDVSVAQAREDNIRLAGVQWIDNVRRALKLPVRTFDTAVVYYHKFRLVHSDGEYSFVDAAAAALFAACKIEDTLKKSRDILCAAHNLKVPRNEHLSPDDTLFEHHSRTIIGLERLMLESSSFDFRNRHPQTLMIKLAKHYNLGHPKTSPFVKTAYAISLDLYRTFAPLKQATATLAFACLELAVRLHNEQKTDPSNKYNSIPLPPEAKDITSGRDYDRWGTSRAEVMETLLDLLELYTHYRASTTMGPEFPLDTFLEVRIPLNKELNETRLPRFTEYVAISRASSGVDPAGYAATVNGVSAGSGSASTTANTAASAASQNGNKSPTSPGGSGGKSNGIRQKAGERGREGTVRFMLNPDRERQETAIVAEYSQPVNVVAPSSTAPPPGEPAGGSGSGSGSGSGPDHPPDNRPRR